MASDISRGHAASTSRTAKRLTGTAGALLVSVVMATTLGAANPAAAGCGVTSATHTTGSHAAPSGIAGAHTGPTTPHVSSAGESCPGSTASTAHIAGATGGLYAPTMTLVPTMGSQFITEAFVTVVTGGGDVFLGAAPAGVILGFIRAVMTTWQGQLAGQIGLLIAVIIVIRVLPRGVSGLILRERA